VRGSVITIPPEFIAAIPKTDLHVHLDGSLRLGSLIEMARERKVDLPSTTEDGLRELVFKDRYNDLGEYLHGFMYTCGVLTDAEALERAAFELAEDCIAENVRYLEVRFAPQLHQRHDFPAREVVAAVHRGLERAGAAHNQSPAVRSGENLPFHSGIIVCAMRMFTKSFSPYYQRTLEVHHYSRPEWTFSQASSELARCAVALRDEEGLPVVGFDLAGQEDGYPADDHREAYEYAHKHFLQKTVHAGEAYGAESIFQAITDLHADRLGHGYHLFSPEKVRDPDIADPEAYCRALIQYIADRRITIEVCLTSNLQTNPELDSLQDHNFKKMLATKLSYTLCTDNRLVSNTSITRELTLAVEEFGLTPRQFKNAIVYGFKRSFFPDSYAKKRHFVRQVLDRYEALEQQYGVDRGPHDPVEALEF